jgi:carbonic anhydrase
MPCLTCGTSGPHHHPASARRRFLQLACAAAMLPGLARADQTAPPKPANLLGPDAALIELMRGNARYVEGLTRRHDFSTERAALAQGQNPFAGILSCADSRVAPEFAFDSFRGDLFVVRVAGNFVNTDNLASFEYAVAVLNTPLLMVLGHSACGAVASTIKSIDSNTTLPGHLPSLVAAIAPAVQQARGEKGDLLTNAIKDNVKLNAAKLQTATPILSAAVASGKLRVVGGYYDLPSGKVEILD